MAETRDIRRVRAVIYDRERLQRLRGHIDSLDVVMNTDPAKPLQPEDDRFRAGSGPNWILQATGEPSSAVLEAATRCEKVARILLGMRDDLGNINFDASDKRHLRGALAAQAAAWRARAAVYRTSAKPENVETLVAAIAGHERASTRHLREVAKYLKRIRPEDIS